MNLVTREIGAPRARVEAHEKVTGSARYAFEHGRKTWPTPSS